LRPFWARADHAWTQQASHARILVLFPPGRRLNCRVVLPEDPDAIVIALDYRDGEIGPPLPRHVEIRADGRIVVYDLRSGKKVEGKLPADQLAELMSFIVNDNAFFACNAEEIQAAIANLARKEGQRQILVSDAATTRLTVRGNGQRHQVDFNALDVMASAYPDIESLTQIARIEQRLRALADKILERLKPI
jgi:hypothetical protein